VGGLSVSTDGGHAEVQQLLVVPGNPL